MSAATSMSFERRPSALAYMLRGALPSHRRAGLAPLAEISARWSDHRVDRTELGRFLRSIELEPAPTLPLLYPHTFGFRLAMAVLTHAQFPVPIWGVLQTRNHLLQHRPIAVGAKLDFETRVSAARVVQKGAELDLETTVQVAGTLAWQSVITFFARGHFGAPEPASPLARAPSESLPLHAEWAMLDAEHWRFGKLTGDYNGIHLWDLYARRFGFPRAFYHPPRVIGQCLARLAPLDPERPQRLDVWLKGPVPHGATVRLHAAANAKGSSFALYSGDYERPRIVGRLLDESSCKETIA